MPNKMAGKGKQEKDPVNIVHQNAILCETITKEQRNQKLYTNYSVNPYKKNLSVVTGKPNTKAEVGEEGEDGEFLRVYKRARGTPQSRYSFPQTEAQEIGWDSEPLVPPLRTDIRFCHPRQHSEITKFMETAWKQKEQENLHQSH